MDKDLKHDAEKAKDTIQGKVERGAEKVKKAWDDIKHDAKIKISEAEDKLHDKLPTQDDDTLPIEEDDNLPTQEDDILPTEEDDNFPSEDDDEKKY